MSAPTDRIPNMSLDPALGPLVPEPLVTQSEDVLVDARGNAYLTDKNHGLFVARYVGH